jgi:hypothetical protein
MVLACADGTQAMPSVSMPCPAAGHGVCREYTYLRNIKMRHDIADIVAAATPAAAPIQASSVRPAAGHRAYVETAPRTEANAARSANRDIADDSASGAKYQCAARLWCGLSQRGFGSTANEAAAKQGVLVPKARSPNGIGRRHNL